MPPPPEAAPSDPAPRLTVRDLRTAVVGPVSLTLPAGTCVALQGPSGSGKSLLLRAVADLDPNQGTVCLDGVPRESLPAPLWRRRVAYVPAETGWWADGVGAHFPDWDKAAPWIERFGLPAEVRNWSVDRLSTGERQRLGLARTLALAPEVLLLDEPTSGLDDAATQAVEAALMDLRRAGTAMLWVTHSADQAVRIADRLLTIDAGKLVPNADADTTDPANGG